jgi:hypothetical protein
MQQPCLAQHQHLAKLLTEHLYSSMKFEISTPLGFTVRTSEEYWQRLLLKHPDIEELEHFVQLALSAPDEVRRSSRDVGVLLFYYFIRRGKKNDGLLQ